MHDLTKGQKRALRAAAELAHGRDRSMEREDRDVHYLEARNAELPMVVGGAIARGIITLEEVGETGRDVVARVAAGLAEIFASEDVAEPETPEDEGYTEGAPVSVAAIVSELEIVREETSLFVNRRTGEVLVMQHEYLPDDDEEDDLEDVDETDWEAEARAEGREVLSNPDWVDLADQFTINDMEIMRRFARRASPAASKALSEALQGRGAYRRFRDEITRRGLLKEWDAFHDDWVADIVRFRLRERGIAYRK